MQPLDVKIFAGFKKAFFKLLDDWFFVQEEEPGKEVVAGMIRTAWEQATDSTSTIKAAFESPGIWPVDPTKLEREGKLSTSVPTALQITIPQLPPMSKKYTNFRAAWQTRINDIYSRMSKTSEHTVLPGLTSTFAT